MPRHFTYQCPEALDNRDSVRLAKLDMQYLRPNSHREFLAFITESSRMSQKKYCMIHLQYHFAVMGCWSYTGWQVICHGNCRAQKLEKGLYFLGADEPTEQGGKGICKAPKSAGHENCGRLLHGFKLLKTVKNYPWCFSVCLVFHYACLSVCMWWLLHDRVSRNCGSTANCGPELCCVDWCSSCQTCQSTCLRQQGRSPCLRTSTTYLADPDWLI